VRPELGCMIGVRMYDQNLDMRSESGCTTEVVMSTGVEMCDRSRHVRSES
jgi:hypothetical protein